LISKPFWSSLTNQLRNALNIPAKNVRVPLLPQRQPVVAVAVDRVRAGTSSNSFGQLLQGSIRAAAQSGIVASFRSNPDDIRIHSAPQKNWISFLPFKWLRDLAEAPGLENTC
jgi:hypothetical protein